MHKYNSNDGIEYESEDDGIEYYMYWCDSEANENNKNDNEWNGNESNKDGSEDNDDKSDRDSNSDN